MTGPHFGEKFAHGSVLCLNSGSSFFLNKVFYRTVMIVKQIRERIHFEFLPLCTRNHHSCLKSFTELQDVLTARDNSWFLDTYIRIASLARASSASAGVPSNIQVAARRMCAYNFPVSACLLLPSVSWYFVQSLEMMVLLWALSWNRVIH